MASVYIIESPFQLSSVKINQNFRQISWLHHRGCSCCLHFKLKTDCFTAPSVEGDINLPVLFLLQPSDCSQGAQGEIYAPRGAAMLGRRPFKSTVWWRDTPLFHQAEVFNNYQVQQALLSPSLSHAEVHTITLTPLSRRSLIVQTVASHSHALRLFTEGPRHGCNCSITYTKPDIYTVPLFTEHLILCQLHSPRTNQNTQMQQHKHRPLISAQVWSVWKKKKTNIGQKGNKKKKKKEGVQPISNAMVHIDTHTDRH